MSVDAQERSAQLMDARDRRRLSHLEHWAERCMQHLKTYADALDESGSDAGPERALIEEYEVIVKGGDPWRQVVGRAADQASLPPGLAAL